MRHPALGVLAAASILSTLLSACGGSSGPAQLSAAQPGTLATCSTLTTAFSHSNTVITSASVVAAGTLSNAGSPVGEHCVVSGKMNQRISTVDGQAYAIGFEMRMPKDWNGRFLYQANGGTDGVIAQAVGNISAGGMLRHALQQGFAVLSSDAGHSAAQNPLFGLDPQARLDYGYQAVGSLTPMAKALVKSAYGRGPDRAYIGGTSNGGRHAMVAAARYSNDYDGYLAGSPGFNLPKAAVAQLYGAQQWATVATDRSNLETGFTVAERSMVAAAILTKCDALDGVQDGAIEDVEACRTAFDLQRDVPTCSGGRDNSCLSSAQKVAYGNVMAGARNSRGEALYARWPYDPGVRTTGWADWKFRNSVGSTRDPVAVGFIFSSPPASSSIRNDTLTYALNFNMDVDAPLIFATSGIYSESSMSFMTPPNPTKLNNLRDRGAKMIVFHGNADPVFSIDDTTAWYDALDAEYNGNANQFVRLFRVPGMVHSRGGPATDQFDALAALVAWVENGQAPNSILATARGPGNAGGVNADLPADWSAARTRPLCPYPLKARYKSGDKEIASSFACEK
jgi:feruloyl esterase